MYARLLASYSVLEHWSLLVGMGNDSTLKTSSQAENTDRGLSAPKVDSVLLDGLDAFSVVSLVV